MTTPWQPQGNVHTLDEANITRLVPRVSGVYGLHNQHQQLFLGEAADLRETLLLHWQESAKLFRGRQPTHFAFEVCDAETRAQRAQRLIAVYRPAVQALQLLSFTTIPTAKSTRKSTVPFTASTDAATTLPQWPQAAITGDAHGPRKYFSRAQFATLIALFIVTAGVSGYLGVVTGQNIGARRGASFELTSMRRPILAYLTTDPTQSDGDVVAASSNDSDPDRKPNDATPSTASDLQLPVQVASAASADDAVATATAKRAVAVTPVSATQPPAAESKQPATQAVSQEASANNWSVQIAATQDQRAAQQLQDNLKNKGFDAYIVEADLNSGRWHRLRVGRFGSQEEAEAARQTLQSKENIRNAFVTAK